MTNIQKFIIICLLIFLLITVGIASWYILSLNYMEEYDLKTIVKIVTQIGVVGAIIPSLTISLIDSSTISFRSIAYPRIFDP